MQRKMQLIRDISNDLKYKKRRIELVFLGPKLGYNISLEIMNLFPLNNITMG
jgi:hypothetical protein